MAPRTSLVKVVILILAAGSHYVGLRAPNPPPSKDVKVYKGQSFEKTVHLLTFASRTTVISFLLAECATILALRSPDAPWAAQILRLLLPSAAAAAPSLSALSALTPRFLTGAALMLSSAALRVWCYRTLGSLFTFEVSIAPSHKLITSGPYARVRHPSYTAVGLMMLGAITCVSAPDGYARQSGVASTGFGKWWLGTWYILSAFSVLSVGRRGRVEDEALKKEFGEQWERYRERVPYKFVPGLF